MTTKTILLTDTNLIQWNGVATDGSDITVACIGGGAGGPFGDFGWVGPGGGEYRQSTIPYTSKSVVTGIKIGRGGIGASINSLGTDGEETHWNTSQIIANGGEAGRYGGAGGTGNIGHNGGDGSAGEIGKFSAGGSAGSENYDGYPGQLDYPTSNGGGITGPYSGNGASGGLNPTDGYQAGLYGGGGAQCWNSKGKDGAQGVIIITYTPPPLLDGYMRFTDDNENIVDVSVPEYGYKSTIDLPFDIDTLDTGIKSVYAYANTLDKYRCNCDLVLTETEMTNFNEFMKDAALGRAKNNCTLQMNTNSGFFPFTPFRGDAGPFTVGIVITKPEKLQDNPFRYFKLSISIFKQGTFPAYSLPDEIDEGSLSLGTVDNIRFPENYFDPDEDNAIQHNVDESGTLNFIDRGRIASSWRTFMELSCGTGKAAAVLGYLVDTIRLGNFTLTTQPYHYAFGRDKGSSSAYTVSMIQDQIVVTHSMFNKFEFSLNVQYISG